MPNMKTLGKISKESSCDDKLHIFSVYVALTLVSNVILMSKNHRCNPHTIGNDCAKYNHYRLK